jgi:hypothetical protein
MKTMVIPQNIDAEGFKVKVACNYKALKYIPFILLSKNSAFPSLILYNEHFNYRVIRKTSAKYVDIEKLDADGSDTRQLLHLYFKNSAFILITEMTWRPDAIKVLEFFQRKSVPLTDKTLEFVRQQ